MKWFRSHIKYGSKLALVALAIQFALSFGHFHGIAAQVAPTVQSLAAAGEPAQHQRQSNPDSDRQSSDACAICAVIAMANTTLFAASPLLLLPQAAAFSYLATDAKFLHLNSARVAFQPRAPAIS